MMDYSLPVARRTRSREALMYKKIHEEIKKRRRGIDQSLSQSESSLKVDDKKGNGSEDLWSDCVVDSEPIAEPSATYEEEEGNVKESSMEEIDVDALADDNDVDFLGMKKLGVGSNERKPQMGIEGFNESMPILLDDDSEDDEMVVLDEGDDLGAEKREENFVYVDDDDDEEDTNSVSVEDVEDTSSSSEEEDEDYVAESEETRSYSGEEDEVYVGKSDYTSSYGGEDREIFGESEATKRGNHEGRKEKPEESVYLEDLSSSSEKEEEEEEYHSEDTERASIQSGKRRRVDDGLKRKKAYGLDISTGNINSHNAGQKLNCVAKHTRSHFRNETKLGRVSHPPCVDEEELDMSPRLCDSDSEDGDNDETYHNSHLTGTKKRKTGNEKRKDDENLKEACGKDEDRFGESIKRKQVSGFKDHDVRKILLSSIWDMKEIPIEDSSSSEEGSQSDSEEFLPSKFTFGEEESSAPEISEEQMDLEKLWTEYDISLAYSKTSLTDPMVENEAPACHEVELNQDTDCAQGNHEIILDEQVGLKCKLCPFVEQEIRYIVPPFATNRWERTDKRDSDMEDQSILDQLQNLESGSAFPSGWDRSSDVQGTVWDIVPGIKKSMFPHQREGFEFIWTKIAGGIDLDKLRNPTNFDGGNGCIISHAPGTGKTRLTIVFLLTYMKLYPECKPVIVAPRSMLLTWEEEFQKWKINIPFHNLNNPELSGKEKKSAVNLLQKAKYGARSVEYIRLVKLYSWKNDKSILGISYRLFEQIVDRRKDDQIGRILLELPGVFVFDEGHTPRNAQTRMFMALSKIKTDKRIILSGTPFQNNFEELYNTLCLVRPKFAERMQSQNQRCFVKKRGRKRNEAKGNFEHMMKSIKVDARLEDEKLREVRSMIRPLVHIHKGTILQENLPGLKHKKVVLKPDDYQKSLLENIAKTDKCLVRNNYLVSLVSAHPSLLPERYCEEFHTDVAELERLRLNAERGIKIKFLLKLLQLSRPMKEKVLVFSQFIEPLSLIMDQLRHKYNWTEGNEVLYMDGKRDVKQRQSSINIFNDPMSEVRVLLASTKACGEGINLVGASRVLLLDVTWNPSVERQAISRAYRLGQKKVVYVYHLITSGTMEEEKSDRQAKKELCSKLVFSSSDGGGDQQKAECCDSLEDEILEWMVKHNKDMFDEIEDQPKESELIQNFRLVDMDSP